MSHPIEDTPPDATTTGKPHYEVLDGLRGTAAVLVVLFHIMGMTANWSDKGQLVHHGHLAVDFFFTLSGFVIGYAYNDRWGRMSLKQFFLTRLVRLHPLVLLGAVLGVLSFVFDPFAGTTQSVIPLRTVAIDFVLIAFLLPHPPLPNRWTDTHSLNSPAWSLLQEYIGNIAYALILRRLKARWLFALLIVTGVGLIGFAAQNNSMDMGSDFGSYGRGMLRMAFSFTLGLWLYRVHDRFPKLRPGWIVLSLVLIAAMCIPRIPQSVAHANGLVEVAMVILLFPLVVLLGAHSQIGRVEMAACKVAGHISYPLYILHYPFLFIYMNYVNFRHPPMQDRLLWASLAFIVVAGFAWAALKLYDEPIRRMLKPLTRV
ncbi:MAG TPA: acyltransferase [Asticcacaulis sp.]|nr:acyltransferase [Asticcacaulis sp.]